MIQPPTYLAGAAAAARLGVSRSTFNNQVLPRQQQRPDALLAPADPSRSAQQLWTAPTLDAWGEVTPERAHYLYRPKAAAARLSVPYPTLNHWMKHHPELFVPDAYLLRVPGGSRVPAWEAETLDRAWKALKVDPDGQGKPFEVYTVSDAAAILRLSSRVFDEAVKQHPVLATEAVVLNPVEAAFTRATFKQIADRSQAKIPKRLPRPVQLYDIARGAALLGCSPADLRGRLKAAGTVPDGVIIDPAESVWFERTLRGLPVS